MLKKIDETPKVGMDTAFPELCQIDRIFKKHYYFQGLS